MVNDHQVGQGKWMRYLEMLATVAVIVASLTVIWAVAFNRKDTPTPRSQRAEPNTFAPRAALPPPKEPISIADAPMKGSAAAPVVVIEYSEFQCPFCGAFARDAFPTIARTYLDTGKVAWVYRHLPLDAIHPFAFKAAESAECAGRQSRFWEMHDRLFRNQKQLDNGSLKLHAQAIGLNAPTFEACLTGQASEKVRRDQDDARRLGVTGTPTFFVGVRQGDKVLVKHRFSGNAPFEQFRMRFEELLATR